MRNFITLLVVMCAVIACAFTCQKWNCSTFRSESNMVADAFAQALSCTGKAAMESDFYAQLEKTGICQNTDLKQGIFAQTLCPIFSQFVVGFGVGKTPPDWSCSGSNTVSGLTSLCELLPW